MARTKPKSFQSRLEERVIDKLMVSPSSISEMANTLGENYHTVRKAFKRLEDQGLLYNRGYRNGSALYKLIEPSAQHKNNSIPMVKGTKGPIKLTGLLTKVGHEDNLISVKGATDLPRTLTRILMVALRNVESNGTYETQKNLKHIRAEIETNVAALKTTIEYYEAILQADVFWDDFKIKAIPYDEDFDKAKVIEAYRHYYPED